jgi:hypothetical protein
MIKSMAWQRKETGTRLVGNFPTWHSGQQQDLPCKNDVHILPVTIQLGQEVATVHENRNSGWTRRRHRQRRYPPPERRVW